MADMNSIFSTLNEVLGKVDLSGVSAESTGFESLPDGYYLCEVEKAELGESKSSHQPMVKFTFKVVEDGKGVNEDSDDKEFFEIKKTKGRKLFINYVLKDESSVKRFATDMLKFEGETPGESLLPKEAFQSSETIMDALELLIGMQIYTVVSTTERDGQSSTWTNLVSWKRADALGLEE